MNCDRAQAAISERMDGERLPGRRGAMVSRTSRLCGLPGVRRAGLTRPDRGADTAPRRIPDLVEPIMARVASVDLSHADPAGTPSARAAGAPGAWLRSPPRSASD